MARSDGRNNDQARDIKVEMGYLKFAEGSCLITAGNTRIVCAATFDRRVPPFLVGSGQGWVTAEYGLLPRSTPQRTQRESATGRPNARSAEIRRFLARSLRAVCDLYALGEAQIILDADVIQADPKYEQALEAVLGDKLQYILVEKLRDGQQAVEYLKVRAKGKSSFVPVADLVGNGDNGSSNGFPLLRELVKSPEP